MIQCQFQNDGVASSATPANQESRVRNCPLSPVTSALIALPREQGPYWPQNFDERLVHGDTVFSTRVIIRNAGPHGAMEAAVDLVFARNRGKWVFVARRNILVVE